MTTPMTTLVIGEIFSGGKISNETDLSCGENFTTMTTMSVEKFTTGAGVTHGEAAMSKKEGEESPMEEAVIAVMPELTELPEEGVGALKYECVCSKAYKCRQNLHRHKKMCGAWKASLAVAPENAEIAQDPIAVATAVITATPPAPADSSIINEILLLRKEVQELREKLDEKPVIINNYNTQFQQQNNMKFDIRTYLNNHCKDALNMNDFVDRINVTLEDMYYTGTNGYVKGMCNVLMKHLDELGEAERPFHCTDKRRLKFFVKTDGEWHRDEDNKSLTNMMSRVTDKHINQLKVWKTLHPDWIEHEDLSKEYLAITSNILDGVHDEKGTRNIKCVIQNISNATALSRKDGGEE